MFKLVIYYLIFFISPVRSEMRFGGPILFKGVVGESSFEGKVFNVILDEHGFSVISRNPQKAYVIPSDKETLYDAVISQKKSAVAVCLRQESDEDSNEFLITLTDDGVLRVAKYSDSEMTATLGWVIELGAVSDDGKLVLAKCAKYTAPRNGINYVNHFWAFLSINEGKVKVVKEINFDGIDFKWPKIK